MTPRDVASPSDLWPALRETVVEVRLLGAQMLRRHRLSVGQYLTLHWIHRSDGLRVSSLAAGLGISRPAASSLVASLEAQGWVRRVRSPTDRRGVEVRSTPRAVSLFARFDREVGRIVRESVEELPRAELAAVIRALERTRSGVRAHRDPHRPDRDGGEA